MTNTRNTITTTITEIITIITIKTKMAITTMIAMKVTIKWITTDMIQIHVKTILMVIMMKKLMNLAEIQGKRAGTCTILSQRMFMMIEMRVGK